MLESNQLHGPLHDFYHVSLALLLNMKFSHRSYETVIHSLRLYNKYFQDSLNKNAWEVNVCSWNLFQHTHVTKNFSQMDIQNNNDIKQRKIRHPGKLNLEGLSFLFFLFLHDNCSSPSTSHHIIQSFHWHKSAEFMGKQKQSKSRTW